MEQTTTRFLERSSDAIVVIRLADGAVLGSNEAFFAVTGHPHHELVGRHVGDLLVSLRAAQGDGPVGAPVGLWTRAGELRCGQLSALVVDVGGQRHSVCAIHEVRDPTPVERRSAARERCARIVAAGGSPLAVATSVLRALGESLRWEFGALWLTAPASRTMRCAAVWRSPLADLVSLEEASRQSTARFGVGLVGRAWRDRRAVWVSNAMLEPDPERLDQLGGELVYGWFGFPVWAAGELVGIAEFFSREVREPDEDILRMTEQLGGLLGAVLEHAGRRPESTGAASEPEAPEIVRGAPQAAAETVATMAAWEAPVAAATDPSPIPTGLTLKAVSRRTGIPAATLRTWERRYQFLRPERSSSGYRLYGEQEVARILKVKQLLHQGVRIGEAMATVARAS